MYNTLERISLYTLVVYITMMWWEVEEDVARNTLDTGGMIAGLW
jgi:hypothetical protein